MDGAQNIKFIVLRLRWHTHGERGKCCWLWEIRSKERAYRPGVNFDMHLELAFERTADKEAFHEDEVDCRRVGD